MRRILSAVLTLAIVAGVVISPVRVLRADEDTPEDNTAAVLEDAVASGAHRCNEYNFGAHVQLDGTFDTTQLQAILDQINSYRREACYNGFPYGSGPLARNLTPDDYVPITWSTALEEATMLRAAEASYTYYHNALSFNGWYPVSYNASCTCEVLAFYCANAAEALEMWYSEKAAYLRGDYDSAGHYSMMIEPGHVSFAMAGFMNNGRGTFCAIFNNAQEHAFTPDETKLDVSGYNSQIVTINPSRIQNVSINMDGDSLAIGSTFRLQARGSMTVNARNSVMRTYDNIKILPSTWGSDNPDVVSVDAVGNACVVSEGTARIYCVIGGVKYYVTYVTNTSVLFRLYNPNSGEHFYTSNSAERNLLISIGWNDEGIGWFAPFHSNTPVYRLYNPNAGEHHYTTNAGERDHLIALGWNYEDIGWYSDDAQRVPLYRQYNPNEFANNHNYTTSLEENNWLVSLGWRAEDIGWYGVG